MDGGGYGIQIDMTYETKGSVVPNLGCTARNITIRNVTGTKLSKNVGLLKCLKKRPCQDIMLDGVHFSSKKSWSCDYADFTKVTGVSPSFKESHEGTCHKLSNEVLV